MKNISIKRLATAAILAALTVILTGFIRIPVPIVPGGYIHPGDSIIYLSAFMLGGWASVAAAAIGSMFADLLVGAPQYMAATFVIKGVMALISWRIFIRGGKPSVFIGVVVSGMIMLLGYFLFEWILLGFSLALVSLPYNLVQLLGGGLMGVFLIFTLEKPLDQLELRESTRRR